MHYNLTLKGAWINFKKNTTQEMKKLTFLFSISLLYTVFLFTGCGNIPGSTESGQYIIDVTGSPMVINCSKSYSFAGHYSYEEEDMVSLVVSAGDLIYFQLMEDDILCYRYNPADGLNLAVSYDTIYDRFYLNNELISTRLSEGSAGWDWLAEVDEKVLRSIRSFHISLPLSGTEFTLLEKISAKISNPGLYLDGDSKMAEVLSLFNPRWLIAEDIQYRTMSEETKANLRHLELLWYEGEDFIDQEFLSGLPELSSLIIESWDSMDITGFQFDKLKNLESLTIIESDIHDLSSIAASSGIRDLNFIYCDSLKEIGAATDLSRIRCLGLNGCENITDISAILQIPQLTRLSLPENTTQKEFVDIVTVHSTLKVLELIGCDGITDLSALVDNTGLKALTLDLDIHDLYPVHQLTGLELLVLAEDFFEDSLAITELRQALPDTRIVAGGGFCLGSGWILLLIPAIILLVLGSKRFSG